MQYFNNNIILFIFGPKSAARVKLLIFKVRIWLLLSIFIMLVLFIFFRVAVIDIDTLGTFNLSKAVFNKCFKVNFHWILPIKLEERITKVTMFLYEVISALGNPLFSVVITILWQKWYHQSHCLSAHHNHCYPQLCLGCTLHLKLLDRKGLEKITNRIKANKSEWCSPIRKGNQRA